MQIELERDRINDRSQLRWSGTRKFRRIGGKKETRVSVRFFKKPQCSVWFIITTPSSYLSDSLRLAAGMPRRSRLRSALTLKVVIPLTCLSTVSDCSFPVIAAKIWKLVV
jgi:hypothetical protein